MALGQHKGTPSVYLDINGKTGEMSAWDKASQKEVTYGYVAGMVTGVDVSEKKWPSGDVSWQLNTRMKDPVSGEKYVVTMGASSRLATRFLGQLNNADLSRPIYIAPYQMKEGDKLQNGEVAKMDATLTSVKYVESINDDGSLKLSEGIKAFYGEQFGDQMPKADPIMDKAGKQIVQNGRPLFDHSARDALSAQLVASVSDRLRGGHSHGHDDGDDEGVHPSDVLRG